MNIRKARSADLPVCASLDHSIVTDHAWRMEEQEQGGSLTVTFQLIRLPRQVRLAYPTLENLTESWIGCDLLVAEEQGVVRGYVATRALHGHGIGWVQDLVVDAPWRRKGIGSQLLRAAAGCAAQANLQRLVVEAPTRNHPGVCFCRAMGLSFCGYHDHHWRTHDIAILYEMNLR